MNTRVCNTTGTLEAQHKVCIDSIFCSHCSAFAFYSKSYFITIKRKNVRFNRAKRELNLFNLFTKKADLSATVHENIFE